MVDPAVTTLWLGGYPAEPSTRLRRDGYPDQWLHPPPAPNGDLSLPNLFYFNNLNLNFKKGQIAPFYFPTYFFFLLHMVQTVIEAKADPASSP